MCELQLIDKTLQVNDIKSKKRKSKKRKLNKWGIPILTKKEKKKNRQKRIDQYKLKRGCENCGFNEHPSALCFNHLPEYKSEKNIITKNGGSKKTDKKSMIAGGMYRLYDNKYPIRLLIEEIRKCNILCSNCHAIITYPNNPEYLKKQLERKNGSNR